MGDFARNELYASFENDFLSIDDTLATQIRIPCRTNVEICGFGLLDPSLESTDLPKGSRLELPFWAVQYLAKPSRGFVRVEVPPKYKKSYRDIIKADPTILDLNKWGPYYYRAGIHLVCLPMVEREAIREILIFLFQKRIQRLSLTYSYMTKVHSVYEGAIQYRTGNVIREHMMDSLELRVYKDAQRGVLAFQKWMETPSRPLL